MGWEMGIRDSLSVVRLAAHSVVALVVLTAAQWVALSVVLLVAPMVVL